MTDAVDPFTAIEDAAVACLKVALANKVKIVDNAPPGWTKDMLKRVMRAVPAVFVCVTGGVNPAPGAEVAQLTPKVSVIIGTSSAVKEQSARRGDGSSIGAYQIAFAAIPALHALAIEGVGEMQFLRLDPVDMSDWDVEGLTLYEAAFEVTDIQLDKVADPATLHPFETFKGDWKDPAAAGPDDPTLASDTVTIPT